MADYRGTIKFIGETNRWALVEETPLSGGSPVSTDYDRHRLVKSDFSARSVGDVIDYDYAAPSNENEGYDVESVVVV